ncbi:hypothetical protein ABBQ32_012574 [Trebouxia sp. C0010 RCD-2024]
MGYLREMCQGSVSRQGCLVAPVGVKDKGTERPSRCGTAWQREKTCLIWMWQLFVRLRYGRSNLAGLDVADDEDWEEDAQEEPPLSPTDSLIYLDGLRDP